MSVGVKKSEGPSSKARQQIQFHGLVFLSNTQDAVGCCVMPLRTLEKAAF